MKKIYALGIALAITSFAYSQETPLPRGYSQEELEMISRGDIPTTTSSRGIATPPPYPNLRSAAEWEEIQALTIAWTGYPGILKQIVAAARLETRVLILSEDVQATENYLLSNNIGGTAFSNLDNVTIIDGSFDSIWMRDYAANPVYGNEVDDLVLVDWIYNRITRPNDNASPQFFADELGLELYEITEAPEDLVNTGGNWMTDGFGTAFASELILEENQPGNPYNVTAKTEDQIDGIVNEYLGIDRYIKMTVLPYDEIHHIDMHMKLIDEETLLVGEYPDGIADGPQINANIEYVLDNFNSKWGTPYKVVRIPMPDSQSGLWPSSQPTAAYYRTYTNAVFVNNTVILPTYREQYDTTALRIWGEILPGYNIIGIDSDNQDEPIISASGAIHCITHSIGVSDPLLISHQALADTEDTQNPYSVVGYINHRSGISQAKLFWKTSLTGAYSEVSMTSIGDNNWQGFIPAQPAGTTVYYYIQGESVSGKVQTRPMPAPEGYWDFQVMGVTIGVDEFEAFEIKKVFPNPASAITCIPVQFNTSSEVNLSLINSLGQEVQSLYNGTVPVGEKKFFFDASPFSSGVYHIRLSTEDKVITYPLLIQSK
jgi:agmatine/peptidylarginine deiminase